MPRGQRVVSAHAPGDDRQAHQCRHRLGHPSAADLAQYLLWLSLLLPGTFAHAPTLVAGTLLGFFAFALLDEAWVVRRFRAQIAPAMRKLASRSTSANGVTTTATVGQDKAVLDSR